MKISKYKQVRKHWKKIEKAQEPSYIHDSSTQSFTCLLGFECYVIKKFI